MLGDSLVRSDRTSLESEGREMNTLYAVVCQDYIKLFDTESEATDWFGYAVRTCDRQHRIVPILTSKDAA
jgi:hypothetical protein